MVLCRAPVIVPGMPLYPADFVEPCLPMISPSVPTGSQWAYEIKHDGFRFLAIRQGNNARIYSRRGHDWSERLPAIIEALEA
jgi:bifunctional non-homologous end joining protein LigD